MIHLHATLNPSYKRSTSQNIRVKTELVKTLQTMTHLTPSRDVQYRYRISFSLKNCRPRQVFPIAINSSKDYSNR